MNELDYYNKFPDVLKNALINKKVRFPDTLQKEYESSINEKKSMNINLQNLN